MSYKDFMKCYGDGFDLNKCDKYLDDQGRTVIKFGTSPEFGIYYKDTEVPVKVISEKGMPSFLKQWLQNQGLENFVESEMTTDIDLDSVESIEINVPMSDDYMKSIKSGGTCSFDVKIKLKDGNIITENGVVP